MKKLMNLKKLFTWKRILIAIAITAVLALISTPGYIRYSRNKAARLILRQLAFAEMVAKGTFCLSCGCESYHFTDGVNETVEAAVMWLAESSFRVDPSVAFHIVRPADDAIVVNGFIAFAAHNSVGSTVYVYDSVGTTVSIFDDVRGGGIKAARENDVYAGVPVNSAATALFRYRYIPSSAAAAAAKKSGRATYDPYLDPDDVVEKLPGQVKFGPNPRDKAPARMVVTVAAE